MRTKPVSDTEPECGNRVDPAGKDEEIAWITVLQLQLGFADRRTPVAGIRLAGIDDDLDPGTVLLDVPQSPLDCDVEHRFEAQVAAELSNQRARVIKDGFFSLEGRFPFRTGKQRSAGAAGLYRLGPRRPNLPDAQRVSVPP